MKKLFTALLLLVGLVSFSQTTGYFRYDSTRFEKVGGNNELIILNGTRNVTGGVLTNLGNGRTAFVTPSGGGGGGGNGIGAIYTQYGITKVNDSTVRADTTVGTGLIGWPRFAKLKDSISSIYTPLSRSISTGYGLTGGGDFSTNRTHLADTAVGAGLVGWPRLAKFRDSIFSVIPAQVNLIAGTNVTITGTYPNKTINAAGDPNWVFLSDYGTPNDGLSDTAAIKAAVATGKNVYVTPGEWLWDGWRCTLNSNQIIRGYGPTSKIRFTKDTANVFWVPQGTHHVQIDYINFIGKGRGSAPGAEVFTESNAIFIQGDSNRVQYCNFKAVKGSGIHLWVASGTMYANEVSYCRFDSCGVGIYALNNAEYGLFLANQAYYCRWGFYERCAGNNTWDAFTSNYNDVGFGLLGSSGCNGDHGSVSNARINHNTTALDIRQTNNEYLFMNVKFYNGAINIGSLDTAKRVIFSNCVLSNNVFTVTKAYQCQFTGGTFGTTAVTVVGSDADGYFRFCNVQNSPYSATQCAGSGMSNPMTTAEDIIVGGASGTPARLAKGSNGTFLGISGGTLQYLSLPGGGDVTKVGTPVNNQIGVWTGDGTIEGDANFTWSGSALAVTGTGSISTSLTSPLLIGGTGTTDDLTLKVTSGVGATGAEFKVTGGNNGATNFLTINNAGEWGINTAPASGFKVFIVSNGNSGATSLLLARNSSSQNIVQIDDAGTWRLGNQSATTSTGWMANKNLVGGATFASATAWLELAAGTATANTAPIKLRAGTNLSTTEAGAIEFDGTHLYFTVSNAGTRYQLDQQAGGVTSITGTANQVIASASTGAITLSAPQDIHTSATPQFGKLGLGAASSSTTYLNLSASGSGISSLRIPAGTAPSSPVDGDIFRTGTGEIKWYNGVASKRLDNGFTLQGGTDANQTISNPWYIIELPTITANRTVTLPSAGSTGDEVVIWVSNSAGFTWSISGTPTAQDGAGASVTTLTNDTVYKFLCIGTNSWLKIN